MRKYFIICIASAVLLACSTRKKNLSGEDVVNIGDFIEFFRELPLPYTIADRQISRKLPDSLLISPKILRQFVPDSVYSKDYKKNDQPKFYAMGKIVNKGAETYLLVKSATQARQMAYVLCFDKDDNFRAAMPLVNNNPARKTYLDGSIDKKYIITTTERYRGTKGQEYYKLNAYVYNSAGVFNLIKIESNEPVIPKEVYNPIDTFPKRHKLSGDYLRDKKNFVSVRDAKNGKNILFFIHIESGEQCTGELKGEAVLIKPGVAQFKQVGGTCMLRLSFSGNKVSVSEEQGCGSFRGIQCAFDGTFTRKKEAVKSKTGGKK
ncbi:MAG: hypothetical protein M9904_14190 [Chitinophagaceae bacterium]|nr:hypothetical protein [Chitinophagaceae bacterium]MCO5241197.1 hypothetical protein [Chitinophagaceae bacterium]